MPNQTSRVQRQKAAARKRRETATLRRQIKKELQRVSELKGSDVNISQLIISSTESSNNGCFLISNVSEGPAFYQRIGRKIKSKSIRIHGYLSSSYQLLTSSTIQLESIVRIAVVYDNTPELALPAYGDIFSTTNSSGVETAHFQSLPAFDQMGRFRILRDKQYVIPNRPSTFKDIVFNPVVPVDMYVPLNVKETEFKGTSDPMVVDNIVTGALYVFVFTESTEASGVPQSYLIVRHRWTDL